MFFKVPRKSDPYIYRRCMATTFAFCHELVPNLLYMCDDTSASEMLEIIVLSLHFT